MHELQGVLERQVRQLAGGVLSSPESSTLDRPAEANGGVASAVTNVCSHTGVLTVAGSGTLKKSSVRPSSAATSSNSAGEISANLLDAALGILVPEKRLDGIAKQ